MPCRTKLSSVLLAPLCLIFSLYYSCKESKKEWITRTIDLESIVYLRHPTNLQELLAVDAKSHDVFNFQRSLNFDAINKETKALDRKAQLFLETPAVDAKDKLVMTGDTKDAKTFFSVKNVSSRKYGLGYFS